MISLGSSTFFPFSGVPTTQRSQGLSPAAQIIVHIAGLQRVQEPLPEHQPENSVLSSGSQTTPVAFPDAVAVDEST